MPSPALRSLLSLPHPLPRLHRRRGSTPLSVPHCFHRYSARFPSKLGARVLRGYLRAHRWVPQCLCRIYRVLWRRGETFGCQVASNPDRMMYRILQKARECTGYFFAAKTAQQPDDAHLFEILCLGQLISFPPCPLWNCSKLREHSHTKVSHGTRRTGNRETAVVRRLLVVPNNQHHTSHFVVTIALPLKWQELHAGTSGDTTETGRVVPPRFQNAELGNDQGTRSSTKRLVQYRCGGGWASSLP